MNISIPREELIRALSIAERFISQHGSLPILANTLFIAEKGRIFVSATNLEVGVTTSTSAHGEQEGKIVVPGKIINDFLRSCSGDVVEFVSKQNTLSIRVGDNTVDVLGFDTGEYPIIPKNSGDAIGVISATTLSRLSVAVSTAISLSDARPELSGAVMFGDGENIIMAATDSFRLAENKETAKCLFSPIIIPRNTVLEITKIFETEPGDVSIKSDGGQVFFSSGSLEIVSRLITGKFPEYQKFIPEKNILTAIAPKEEIEKAVRAASLFASHISDIEITREKEAICVSAKNQTKGEAHTKISAKFIGQEDMKISVNYRYFLDGIRSVRDSVIRMGFSGSGAPLVICPQDTSERFVYLTMPLRL